MKSLLLVALIALIGSSALADNHEETTPEKKQTASMLMLRKIVGGLDGEHPGHPSSGCMIFNNALGMVNHDLIDGFETTTTKQKRKKWKELSEIQANIQEALKSDLKRTKVFVKPHEPTVKYEVVTIKLFKTKLGDEVRDVPAPVLDVIYEVGADEKKRENDATDWLIEFIDDTCPNDKPSSKLVSEE